MSNSPGHQHTDEVMRNDNWGKEHAPNVTPSKGDAESDCGMLGTS